MKSDAAPRERIHEIIMSLRPQADCHAISRAINEIESVHKENIVLLLNQNHMLTQELKRLRVGA